MRKRGRKRDGALCQVRAARGGGIHGRVGCVDWLLLVEVEEEGHGSPVRWAARQAGGQSGRGVIVQRRGLTTRQRRQQARQGKARRAAGKNWAC